MVKIHTAVKRRLGIRSTTRKHRFWFTRVVAKRGEKSFVTKEKAEAWAKEHKVDTKKMVLHPLQNGKKYQWRAKPKP